jgi:hypothetical protein
VRYTTAIRQSVRRGTKIATASIEPLAAVSEASSDTFLMGVGREISRLGALSDRASGEMTSDNQ